MGMSKVESEVVLLWLVLAREAQPKSALISRSRDIFADLNIDMTEMLLIGDTESYGAQYVMTVPSSYSDATGSRNSGLISLPLLLP
jgi:hypothetical protein